MLLTDIVERQVSLKISLPELKRRMARCRMARDPEVKVQAWQRFAGLTLRIVFSHCACGFDVSRGTAAKRNDRETAYDTPDDLVRLALGFAVCGWLVFKLFRLPEDAGGYRSWLYIGLAGWRSRWSAFIIRGDQISRLDQPAGRRLDHRLGAGGRAELAARIVDVKSTVRLVRSRICAISAEVLPRAAQVKHSTSRSFSPPPSATARCAPRRQAAP